MTAPAAIAHLNALEIDVGITAGGVILRARRRGNQIDDSAKIFALLHAQQIHAFASEHIPQKGRRVDATA